MTGKPAGPLDGVTVLDLCSYLAGPSGCTLLADLGANMIKIESPQGDMLRQFPSSLPGESRFFLGTNRGKRELALDLKQHEGLAVSHRMVGLPRPEPATGEPERDGYVFERPVTFHNPDGTTSTGFIDLYRHNAFVLDAQPMGQHG